MDRGFKTNLVQHLSKQGGNYHGGKQPLNY